MEIESIWTTKQEVERPSRILDMRKMEVSEEDAKDRENGGWVT